jgi:hypothetical protein
LYDFVLHKVFFWDNVVDVVKVLFRKKMSKKTAFLTTLTLSTFLASPVHAINYQGSFSDPNPKFLPLLPFTPLNFRITNNTGKSWTDFHIEVMGVGGIVADSFSGVAGFLPPINDPYVGPGRPVFGTTRTAMENPKLLITNSLDISDLMIPDGTSFIFSTQYFCEGQNCSSMPVTVSGFPTMDNTSTDPPPPSVDIPEPNSLFALLGLGLGGLITRKLRTKTH